MKSHSIKTMFVFVLAIAASCAFAQTAGKSAPKARPTTGSTAKSKTVIDQAPEPVKAAFEKEMAAGYVTNVAKANEGTTVYVAVITKGGEKMRIVVTEDGTVRNRVPAVAIESIPANVHKGLQRVALGGTISDFLGKGEMNGRPTYTAILRPVKTWSEITFDESGKVVKTEAVNPQEELSATTVSLESVPAAVKPVIEKESESAKLVQIEKGTENGKVMYAAEFLKGQERSEISVGEDGKIDERVLLIKMRQVPQAVQAALKKEAPGGRVGSEIEKSTDANPTYTFSVKLLGDPIQATVGANGRPVRSGGPRAKKSAAPPSTAQAQ